jgi:23S rRNA (cytidine2498-2'-O)-methyltransferase
MPNQPIVFSADPEYFVAAQRELSVAFPKAAIERLGPDLGRLTGGPAELTDMLDALREQPVVFVRHLMREVATLPLATVRRDKQSASRAVLDLVPGGGAVGLQIWASGESKLSYGNEELWHHLAHELGRRDVAVSRSGADTTLGLAITGAGILVGLTPRLEGYADWPGGRIRLRRDEGQVSRAEFKLEELLALGVVTLPDDGLAVDLGAAPGGWTRVLRRAGLRVIAVDPGALDDRLIGDPEIRHVAQTAGPFLARTDEPFDLVVNDMRMVPALSVGLMLTASRHLTAGGLGIMSLKLTPDHATETVQRALAELRRAYEIVFARQLYHNRNEATVVVQRR